MGKLPNRPSSLRATAYRNPTGIHVSSRQRVSIAVEALGKFRCQAKDAGTLTITGHKIDRKLKGISCSPRRKDNYRMNPDVLLLEVADFRTSTIHPIEVVTQEPFPVKISWSCFSFSLSLGSTTSSCEEVHKWPSSVALFILLIRNTVMICIGDKPRIQSLTFPTRHVSQTDTYL